MSEIVRAFPLTPLQEGMLYHAIRHPGSTLYHGQMSVRFRGPLNLEGFRDAWARAARRHEVFRTFFTWERRERPLQVVLQSAELPIRVVDWSKENADDAEDLWASLLEHDADEPFDLGRAPLMRVTVVDFGDDAWGLVWAAHHAVLDGWSARIVWREVLDDLVACLDGDAPDRPAAPSFAEFVGWLEEYDNADCEAWWRNYLDGVDRPTPAPGSVDAPPSTQRRYVRRTLSEDDTRALAAATARLRVTPATLTAAAWAMVLARHAGASDVVFGLTTSERPAEIPGIGEAAGLYLGTVPVRVRLTDEPVETWLSRVQSELSEARARSAPGLSEIRRWSGVGAAALVRTLVVFESFPSDLERAPDTRLQVDSLAFSSPSDLPMALLAFPGEELLLELEYDPACTTVALAQSVLDELVDTLGHLSSPQPASVREHLTPSRQPSPPTAPPPSWTRGPTLEGPFPDVLALFDERAAADPDAVAIVAGDQKMTYGELAGLVAAIAAAIGSRSPAAELVGIPAHRSIEAVAAMLGCLRAGCAYVPLNPDLPTSRLAGLLRRVDAVVTPPSVSPSLPEGRATIWPDGDEVTRGDLRVAGPEDTAYVIFTSGSTGEPKGVVVERGHLAWSTAARLAHYGNAPDVFLMLSPLAVDSSIAGLYWTLCTGGTLVIPPHRAEQDTRTLTRTVRESGVTHMLLVPSLYRELLDDPDFTAPGSSLRLVVVAGEACSHAVAARHRRLVPGVRLYNEYGPSEATVWATVDELTAGGRLEVTIGRPAPGARAWVVDEDLREVTVGAPGELVLGGPGIARGYLGEPDSTTERFIESFSGSGGRAYRSGDEVRWRTDGRLEFLGRLDDQLKVRGHRLQALEIESALNDHPSVREALVTLAPRRRSAAAVEVDSLIDMLEDLPEAEVERWIRSVEEAQ